MEQLLHYVWKHKLFPLKPLLTAEGESIEIIDPGQANYNAGPDFFNAKIKIGGVVWVGNIEIHQQSSEWERHGHHLDSNYDSVILHVASEIDASVRRSDGETIPQLELHCPGYLSDNYRQLIEADRYPACYRLIPALPKLLLHSWLSRLQTERFEQKTDKIMQLLGRHRKDWEHVFFIILARNFGFGTNSDAFEFWAETIPLQAVNKHRDSLFQIEAFFFGQAGLLQEVPADEYTDRLMKEYTYLSHKFGLRPSANSRWKLLRMRPDNFPHVRIAQLASFYYRSQGLLSALMEAQSLKSLRDMLRCGTSEYWLTHYVFGEASPPHPKTLSNQTIDLLVINTVIPFLYAYGKYKTDNILIQRANGLLEEMRPENNFIVRIWKECGLEAAHAGDSQALIQLKKNYCDIKKCLYCRIGYEYLKKPQCGGQ
ncbi:MAG: DUF2851 family protein [Candidatus Phocaeicola excrementipullorum]|mgnify:FL=1|uniref:DUF2851 family protein n=1 Tax=Candidatus Phocaeicola excrementipullorum TaxID=2838731 RepID=A0A948TLI5_9BACT|nr:DUF2851 family protein [Candidatus Phocaeicola excrementipullorum]MBW9199523.1 DUF2851 family protein [Bacteroidales bacterium SW299]